MRAPLETTVRKLFAALESRGIRYAVLRNYEMLPALANPGDASPHTDIDLVVDSRDLDRMRAAVAGIAEEDEWDVLSECDHWAQSHVRHHNINVFRFERRNPAEYLQVDMFHAFLLWGLPLYGETEMLEGRVHDEARGITRIDPIKENTYRLVQVHGLFPGSARKRARYVSRILAYRAANREAYDCELKRLFGDHALRAADALECNDERAFLHHMSRARRRFALGYISRHAASVPWYAANRTRDQILRFYARQCGFRLRLAARDESQRIAVRRAMNDLVQKSYMDEWIERSDGAGLRWNDHKAMEQGAIVIEWTSPERAQIDVSAIRDPSEITDAILSFCDARHKTLYARKRAHSDAAVEVRAS